MYLVCGDSEAEGTPSERSKLRSLRVPPEMPLEPCQAQFYAKGKELSNEGREGEKSTEPWSRSLTDVMLHQRYQGWPLGGALQSCQLRSPRKVGLQFCLQRLPGLTHLAACLRLPSA